MVITFVPLLIIFCFLSLCYFLAHRNQQINQLKKSLIKNELNLSTLTSELTLLKKKQAHDVLYDSLTGLPARGMFQDRLMQTLSLSKRNKLIFAVMYLSLDKVSEEGNEREITIEVARRLQDSIRTIDTVSPVSSNKFVFILAQLLKAETAGFVAQRLLDAIAKPIKIQEKEFFLTAKIGIATHPLDSDNAEELMKSANVALQQVESSNTYHFYSAEIHTLSQRELKLALHLQDPDIYQDLFIHYQPIIDTQTQNILFMDTLLHWRHQEFGLLPLSDFLKLAENNGKILEIGAWLLKHAFARPFLQWQVNGVDTVSISLSTRQLEAPRFAYDFSMMVQEQKLNPKHIVLEISEVSLGTKIEVIEKVFNMLKHMGVRIILKYVGSGHLTIHHLQRLPIDSIKISHIIIKDLGINPRHDEVVKMIIVLCDTAQIKVIAEGVDVLQQKERLIELGCHIMQGSFFCAPLELVQSASINN